MNPTTRDEHLSRIAEQGYTVIENAIEPELIDELDSTLEELERELAVEPAGNAFEGTRTLRVYNLLARNRVFESIPVHPSILPVVEGVLDGGCLISSLSSIKLLPDETEQPFHADDQLMSIPRPHPATVCNSMWALTDFTKTNGATRIVPGSHLNDAPPEYGPSCESIAAEMPRGSVLVWNGSLWHAGGANRSDKPRTGIAMNYCAGFIRQQENQQLGIPLATVKRFEPRLQELCGFGIYNGLIGHIDKQSPAELMLAGTASGIVWDG